MKKVKIISLFVLSMNFGAFSQDVKIGNAVPDMALNNMVNYNEPSVRISDFKGKLLILDFWATWCHPCVAAFPKLDSLQKKFNKDIQILSVTTEESAKVRSFLAKMKIVKKLSPPSATGDRELTNYFKHIYLPHYVWIDKKGQLIAITESSEVNEKNIASTLKGELVKFRTKQDTSIENKSQAEVDLKNLSGYREGKLGLTEHNSNSITIINAPILTLYKVALWKHGIEMMTAAKMVVDIPDTAIYNAITPVNLDRSDRIKPGMDYENWLRNGHGFCYEANVPAGKENTKFDLMVQELNQYFGNKLGIEGVVEKRNTKCLALIRTDSTVKIATKGGAELFEDDAFSLKMVNHSISYLLANLAYNYQSQPPLVDQTGFKGKIDLDLSCTISDVNEMNKALSKYGLKFVEKFMPMDVAVIRL
ncbi:MAG: TlpA disulfide reductase family protein, partial [Janthinobacterium sp.]